MGNFDYPWDIPEEQKNPVGKAVKGGSLTKEEEQKAFDELLENMYFEFINGVK